MGLVRLQPRERFGSGTPDHGAKMNSKMKSGVAGNPWLAMRVHPLPFVARLLDMVDGERKH